MSRCVSSEGTPRGTVSCAIDSPFDGPASRTLALRWCSDEDAARALESSIAPTIHAAAGTVFRVLGTRRSSPCLFAAVKRFEQHCAGRFWLEQANAHQALGSETDRLIVRVDAAITPAWLDAFAAMVGTLRAGGALELWVDPALRAASDTRFMTQVLTACRAIEHAAVHPFDGTEPRRVDASVGRAVSLDPLERVTKWMTATDLTRPRVMLVTGPRGAGKSTLVARAWVRAAPGLNGTAVLIGRYPSASERFEAVAAAAGRPLSRISVSPAAAVGAVGHAPSQSTADLWIVEEAAQWPAEVLLSWARAGRRLCLVSTTAGYEGSGAGLGTLLIEALDAEGLGIEVLALEGARRCDPGDAVGRWLAHFWPELLTRPASGRAVARGGEPGALSSYAVAQAPEAVWPVLRWLAQGHYRTRPSDVWRWLDDPSLRLFVMAAPHDAGAIAAALVQAEPGLDATTIAAVQDGLRRPGAARVTGALALAGETVLAGAPAWRIMRLLVAPAWRNGGVGRALVDAVVDAAASSGARVVGASFGATPRLTRFWTRCGFVSLWRSRRRDPMTGRPAETMVRRLGEQG